MSTVPTKQSEEGGMAGLTEAVQRHLMTTRQTEYMNALTRLKGMITGIRSFTGANNSNATADRLEAELPTFQNTQSTADALNKLYRLRQEVAIIKRLGYFLPDADADRLLPRKQTATPTQAAPAQAAPAQAPPPGAVIRDYTQVGP
jgi:hypothetical protein